VLDARAKAELAEAIQHRPGSWIASPVKRVFIAKGNGKQRPLGIPVILDRARQAVVLSALEPEWEARFEPKSYGFRPGRGCHDAIAAIYCTLKGPNPRRVWVLDADLTAAFDHIDHDHLLASLGAFPARDLIGQWLKAGVIDRGRSAPSEEGTPQGGVISPLLFNVALHGMETAAGVRYYASGRDAGSAVTNSPVAVRFADDFVVMCASREQAEQVKTRLTQWLAPRGLAFNEDKTRIVHAEAGFDFLGFNVRRYHGKLLIKPSTAAVRGIRERLRTEMRSLRGANAGGTAHDESDRARVVGLLPDGGVQRGVHRVGQLRMEARLQVGQTQPPEQVEVLDSRSLLRPVQQDQAGPVGVRRPRQRRLPAQVLLDEDRPAPAGQGRSIPR
jgi:RNA-directed DNA polymerase